MPAPVVRRHRLGRWPLGLALGLIMVWMSPGGAAGQIALKGTVKAPSTGNELTVEVSNVSAEVPVQGLSVALAGQPRYLTNVSILPERVPAVMPGQAVEIKIRFDVRADAPAGQAETLALRVTAEGGTTIDFPAPRLTVTFVKPPPPAAGSASVPAYRLVRIEGPSSRASSSGRWGVEYQPGSPGMVVLGSSIGGETFVASVHFTRFPTEIVPGQPFEIAAAARERRDYPDGYPYCERQRRPAARMLYVFMQLDYTRYAWQRALNPGDSPSFRSQRVAGFKDLTAYCDEARLKMRRAPGDRPAIEPMTREDTVGFVAKFLPVGISPRPDGSPRSHHYRVEVSSTGNPQSQTQGPIDFLPAVTNRDRLLVGLEFLVERVRLVYESVDSAGPAAAVTPFQEPADFGKPPASGVASGQNDPASGAGQDSAAGGDSPPAPGSPPALDRERVASVPPGVGAPAPGATGAGVAPSPPPGAAPRPVDPARLDPRSPEIAGLISQWLGVAEPPDNARGARLRYDEWGRMIGTGVNREQIAAGARPDAAGALAPTAYVWTLRDRLDSVNHCKLGEYVLSMLQGDSIARCQGRYAAPPLRVVASLAGLPAQEAEAKVRAQGLVPDLIGGDPPPSREREYTVQAQEPPAGSRLGEGERVALKIHSGYVDPRRPVPDLRRIPVAEAERRLREMGFRAELTGGDPPQSRAGEYTVQAQDPPAGSQLGEGQRVALKIHSGYVDPRRPVPELRGLGSAEAERRLREMGFRAELTGGDPPQSRAGEYTVQAQDPPAGSPLGEGERVALKVHSGYVEPDRPQVVAPQPPAGGGLPPQARPGEAPSRAEPEICATYYSNLPDLGLGADRRMSQLAAQSAVAAGCDPQRVQQAVAGGLAPAQPSSPPPPPPAVPLQPQAPPALPSARQWPAPQQDRPPSGGRGEPAACVSYYQTLTELARADEGPNGAVARMTAQSALSAGCSPQRIQQALAAGAASPYSRRAAPAPPPSQPQAVPPRGGGAPTTGEPPVCAAHYARMAQWSRTYSGGSSHQAVQNEARKAVAAGCNRQRVEQILAQGRPPAPAPPPRSPARPGTFPPPAQVSPGGSDRCPGGGSPILGQC